MFHFTPRRPNCNLQQFNYFE